MASSHLYAELLLNIRQLTIFASLKSVRNEETRVNLSSDREAVSLEHEGQVSTIRLPTQVGGSAALTLPSAKSKEISFRVAIADKNQPAVPQLHDLDNYVPWSAGSLTSSAVLSCRKCGSCFIQGGVIKTWKDLPSENWAEMMDFWHCHKPDAPENGADAVGTANKGYAASNRLVAQPGTGFVDLCSFLLSEEDCSGIKSIPTEQSQRPTALSCTHCKTVVGAPDDRAEGWRLYKWSLSVRSNRSAPPRTYPVEPFISAQLLALIDSQAVRKFVVHCNEKGKGGAALICWVFTPDLRYSSSTKPDEPRRAMKMFYQEISNPEELITKQSANFEEVHLPTAAFRSLRTALENSNDLMPPPTRTFQEWQIGLLERFDRNGYQMQDALDRILQARPQG